MARPIGLRAVAATGAAGVVAVRVLGTHTTFDGTVGRAVLGRAVAVAPYGDRVGLLLHSLPVVVPAALAALVAVLWRRRRAVAIASVAVVGGTFATAELLKLFLGAEAGVPRKFAHGYPSGHAALALSLGLALMLAVPPARRWAAAAAASGYATAVGAAVILDGWHVPTDVAGGFFVALAWAGAVFSRLETPPGGAAPAALAAVLAAASSVGAILVVPGLDSVLALPARVIWTGVAIAALAAALTVAGLAAARR